MKCSRPITDYTFIQLPYVNDRYYLRSFFVKIKLDITIMYRNCVDLPVSQDNAKGRSQLYQPRLE